MGVLTVRAPEHFEYLTDGRRLVMFLEIDAKGCFVVEDAMTDEVVVIPPSDTTTWRTVRRAA